MLEVAERFERNCREVGYEVLGQVQSFQVLDALEYIAVNLRQSVAT